MKKLNYIVINTILLIMLTVIFPLVSQDFYKEQSNHIITPPKLLSTKYISENELEFTFDQPITIEEKRVVNGNTYFLKDQFFFKNTLDGALIPAQVVSVAAQENKLTLRLATKATYSLVTYLPSKFYTDSDKIYNGPWLTGRGNQLGALSFHQHPVTPFQNVKEDVFLAHGYQMVDSTFNEIPFKLVFPKKANEHRNWVWRARFWGHEPQTDLALLKKGFHIAYIDVAGLFGNEEAIRRWDKFYEFLTQQYHLNAKAVLEGMSRGGLVLFNWANRNADKVACIYVDAPVCDFKSWPAGQGSGKGAPKQWETCLQQYGLSEVTALKYNGNPVNHMENLASHRVPIISVVGNADKVVPVSENTILLEKRLNILGWKMTIINKPGVGHHPHSLENPKPIIDYILKHSTI